MGRAESDTRFAWNDARAVFWRWERLRLAYNAIVGLLGLVAVAPFVIDRFDPSFRYGTAPSGGLVLAVVLYAAAANTCYFLGPLLECYVRWLGWNSRWLTRILYSLGVLVSVAVTLTCAVMVWLEMSLEEFLGFA